MNFHYAMALLICLTTTVEGNCFLEGQPEKHINDEMKKLAAPVVKKCQEKTPPPSDQDLKKCVNETLGNAAQDCSKEHAGKDQKTWFNCFTNKLGNEKPTDEEMSFDFYKNELLTFTKEESKKIVGDELDKCKTDPNFWDCGYKLLAEGPCPEVKPFYDQMNEWKKAIN